jgi:hypothetical protein
MFAELYAVAIFVLCVMTILCLASEYFWGAASFFALAVVILAIFVFAMFGTTPETSYNVVPTKYTCIDGSEINFIVFRRNDGCFEFVNLNGYFEQSIPDKTSVTVKKTGGYTRWVIFPTRYTYELSKL